MKRSAFDYFKGRKLVIATQHKKEKVIAPLLLADLGLETWAPEYYNTDVLGTFSGEVERNGNVVEVLRQKCEQALAEFDFDLGVANEGSFGPHPAVYFAHADEEWVILKDKKNGWEFIEKMISLSTNFNAAFCNDWNEVEQFAHTTEFPSHALIVRIDPNDFQQMQKGIQDWAELRRCCNLILEEHGKVYLETDMRAMFNPTRMLVIEEVTKKLIERIKSLCPRCELPGFGITQAIPGLPCALCSYPTQSTLKYIKSCNHCGCETEENFPHQKLNEDPMYCDHCNP